MHLKCVWGGILSLCMAVTRMTWGGGGGRGLLETFFRHFVILNDPEGQIMHLEGVVPDRISVRDSRRNVEATPWLHPQKYSRSRCVREGDKHNKHHEQITKNKAV